MIKLFLTMLETMLFSRPFSLIWRLKTPKKLRERKVFYPLAKDLVNNCNGLPQDHLTEKEGNKLDWANF